MIRLLHIADIHIGTKFAGRKESVRKQLKKSVMLAFRRSIDYAIQMKVDGVIIAGDLFDGSFVPFQGEVTVLEMLKRLEGEGIHLFYTTGNHDPYQNNGLFERLKTMDYIHLFYQPVPSTVQVTSRNGETYTVTSAGHNGPKISKNVIASFPEKSSIGIHIGIGHTMVAAIQDKVDHGNYMPCSLEDLKRKNYDYFALGHIHKAMALDEEGRIRYAGNIQGRHYKETGPKGGYLITFDGQGFEAVFVPLHDIMWHQETVELSPSHETVYDLVETVRQQLDDKNPDEGKWICRIHLIGETPLYHRLQDEEAIEELEEMLCETLSAIDVRLKTKAVSPPMNKEELALGDHFLGSFLSMMATQPEKIRAYTTDIEFLSEKGRKSRERFLEENLAVIEDQLIKRMKK